MSKKLSEQVAELESERDDLQRQVQEARDECDALRAERNQVQSLAGHALDNQERLEGENAMLRAGHTPWHQPDRLSTIHDLNIAPEGSLARIATGHVLEKDHDGCWRMDGPGAWPPELIINHWPDLNLLTPEAADD